MADKFKRRMRKWDTGEIPSLGLECDECDITAGLSSEQVSDRLRRGLHNGTAGIKTKSEKQIILENIFTFFNTINFILAIMVILVGLYQKVPIVDVAKNVMFMGVIFANIIIGSFQEIRSKRTIDKLSLISAPKARVIRDGMSQSIAVSDIVVDDILHLSTGNQVCSDSIVMDGEAEVNESLITGESDPVTKRRGDTLLSGSFIISGDCLARVEHVGSDNYAQKIAGDAKYLKKPNSEIMKSLNTIVRVIGFSIIPMGLILFSKQFFILGDTLHQSIFSTVAALIGMIPEGLVLLTSVVFAVSVIRLSRHKTLVQELFCIETLARVDVLCLDKTGTITEGTMQVNEFIPFEGHSEAEMEKALGGLVSSLRDDNPTFNAILDRLGNESDWEAGNIVPFSSARKWSGAEFAGRGTFVMGAGEFILGSAFLKIKDKVESYSKDGYRVLLLAHSKEGFREKELPGSLENIGLVLISDKIRAEAPRTLRYFADQGVDLKVISGDNAVTVSNIAKKAGLENAESYIDASTLETDEDIAEAIEKYSVFGRVTPQQKLKFVKALKSRGHTVAMTGDGVNDVLALKESDCSIAMASGSDAARTVSNLVLLDSNFASMPKVVEEGRRSINNLQRSAALFLTKTIYSVIIGILFIFVDATYPFEPIHLTLISTLTIGIPSFILALEPNKERIKGKFIINVINKSIPAAFTTIINIVFLVIFENTLGLQAGQLSTLAVIMTTLSGLVLLVKISFPFNILRTMLFGFVTISFIIAIVFFGGLFSVVYIDIPMLMVLMPLVLFTIFSIMALTHLVENMLSLREDMFIRHKKVKKRKPGETV